MKSKKDTGMYIGMLSGTSMDAVDVALCSFEENTVKLLHTISSPYPDSLREKVLQIIHSRTIDLIEFGELDYQYGILFADAVNQLVEEFDFPRHKIMAIGSHGQSLYHAPSAKYPFTLTLGNGQLIAEKTGIHTINDFRTRDILLGGQGAPLAPAFHNFVFANREKNCVVVNIGGISNLTFLPCDPNEKILGYDTGPGNILMDHWINKSKDLLLDKNGDFARSGSMNPDLLQLLLSEPYFAKAAPKSTGRELFNASWLKKYTDVFSDLKPEDVQATLLNLTVVSLVNEIKKLPLVENVILCGGGAKNTYLVESIQSLMPCKVCISDEMGVSGDWMEAMLFAWLARENWHDRPGNCIHVTGAKFHAVLGTFHTAQY